MVKFGAFLKKHIEGDEWKDHYLKYKRLKKLIKAIQLCREEGKSEKKEWDKFVVELEGNVNHMISFFLNFEKMIDARIQDLEPKFETFRRGGLLLSETNSLISRYNAIGEDLLRLIRFAELNVMGLRKILKKHDKQITDLPALTTFFLDGFDESYPHVALHKTIVGQERLAKRVSEIEKIIDDIKERHNDKTLSKQQHSNNDDEELIRTKPLTVRLREAQHAFERSCNDLKRARARSTIQDKTIIETRKTPVEEKKKRTKEVSPLLFSFHLLAFLIFQTNYYIILPTVFSHVVAFRMPLVLGVALFTAIPVGSALLNVLPSAVQSSLRNDFVSRFFVAALGNSLYAFAVVADYLSPGIGFWVALMGRILIGFSAFGHNQVLLKSSSSYSSSKSQSWRGHIVDDNRVLDVNHKWRLCFAVMRTLSSATGLMVGMIPAAFILEEESKTHYFAMQESFKDHDATTFWNLCFGASSKAAWLMVLMWMILLAISSFHTFLKVNGLSFESDRSSEEITTEEDDEENDEEDEKDMMVEELTPLVSKKLKKRSILPETTKRTTDVQTGNLIFGIPKPMLLFYGVALWLEILREIILIVTPIICVGIRSFTLSGTSWFLQVFGVVMFLSYLLTGWLSGRFVAKFGVQKSLTSTFVLVLVMITIDVTLFEFVYETRDHFDFRHFEVFAMIILALGTIASVNNMLAICNRFYNLRPSKWTNQSTIQLLGEVSAGIIVSVILFASMHHEKQTSTFLELASSNVFSFLVVGQTALTITATALLCLY